MPILSSNPFSVEATLGTEVACDPGQPITVTVTWDVHPTSVFFLYLPPGEEMPVVDDGYGQEGSAIELLATEPEVYRTTFPTKGFEPGEVVWWKFWGEIAGRTVVSKFGRVRLNDVPSVIA